MACLSTDALRSRLSRNLSGVGTRAPGYSAKAVVGRGERGLPEGRHAGGSPALSKSVDAELSPLEVRASRIYCRSLPVGFRVTLTALAV